MCPFSCRQKGMLSFLVGVDLCNMKLINTNGSNRAAYTPAEFAKLFGREKTWTYRQIYHGRLKSIKGHGGQLIPASEAERIVSEAEFID